ncbi:hypothetical protein [Methylobacterium sp. Leaf123]|uniref:hypothetical protein n=1 Tax=Methylobacterium sp. Leaf123 TaxID=1736264 RepID=UPI0006FD7D22|nr:hypothetical protein [Methylobacterium sp. Leaf123]
MMQDHSRNRTPMPTAQPPAGAALPEPGPGPARAEAGIAQMLTSAPSPAPHSKISDDLRAALDELAAAAAAGWAETSDDDEAFDVHEARQDAADDVLLATPCRSLADVGAKLTCLIPRIRPDLLNKRHAEHLEAMRLDIDRMLVPAVFDGVGGIDPIFAALATYREAAAAMDALSDLIRGRRPSADEFAEENRLSAKQCRLRDAALATVPTTPAGRAALAQFVRDEMDASGTADGGPPDDDHPIWRDGLRALLAAQDAEIRTASAAAHPDAALLAQGSIIAGMTKRRDDLYPAVCDLELAAHHAVGQPPEIDAPEIRDWGMRLRAEKTRNGHGAADAAWSEADSELLANLIGLAEIRATTMDGLTFKARLAHEHEVEEIANGIVADLIAMAEAGEGRQIKPSLSDQIIACWREWATQPDGDETDQGTANFERLSAQRFALCDAAESLPATLSNAPTKALALAWVEYVDLWQNGTAREAYSIDGRLALDIDTAICGRLKTRYSGEAA